MAIRTAHTDWHGTLQDGSGRTELASSGLGTFDVSWPKLTSAVTSRLCGVPPALAIPPEKAMA